MSIDPKLLWEGSGFEDAEVAQPPPELGHWRVDALPAACASPVTNDLKQEVDGCRHILREAGYPATAPLLEPLGAEGFALLEMANREAGFVDLIAQNRALATAIVWLRPLSGSGIQELGQVPICV